MKQNTLNKLKSKSYKVASKALKELIKSDSISDSDLETILYLADKTIIGDFLQEYKKFTNVQLKYLETFIVLNLDNDNRLFVSDLIEFSIDWGLLLPYKKCIEFLTMFEDDNLYVQIASLDYIFENLKTVYFDEIYDILCSILNNPESNQSVQVRASFMLFRFTAKPFFLQELGDLVVNGDDLNKSVLKNILAMEFNKPQYFEGYSQLLALLE